MSYENSAKNGFKKQNQKPTKRNGAPLSPEQINAFYAKIDSLSKGEPYYKTTPPLKEPDPDYSEI